MDLLCLSLFAVRTHRHDDAHQPVSRIFIDALSGDGRLNFGGHFGNWDSTAWIYGRVGLEYWHRYGVFYGTIFGDDCLVWDAVFISGQSKKICQFFGRKIFKITPRANLNHLHLMIDCAVCVFTNGFEVSQLNFIQKPE